MQKIKMPFKYIKKLVAILSKNHPEFDQSLNITNDSELWYDWVAKGDYDYPPIYFQYRYTQSKPGKKARWIKETYDKID